MKTSSLVSIAICFVVLCGSAISESAFAEDQTRIRSAMMPTAKSIAMFEARVKKSAADIGSRKILGQLYLRRAKEEDRFHDLLAAEEQFSKILEINKNDESAKILLAYALLTQHRFKEAESWAKQYLADDPQDPSAMAILFDSQMQLGKYDLAKLTIEKMHSINNGPQALVRLASLHELHGKVDLALAKMQSAVDSQMKLGDLAENNAWYFHRFAQMLFDAGRIDQALVQANEANKLNQEYPQALALTARIAAARGHNEKAIKLCEQALKYTDEPPIQIDFADLLASLGNHERAKNLFDNVESMMNEEEKDPVAGPPHARERAIYFSNHGKKLEHAASLAARDLDVRADIQTYDVLAWSLYKAGQREKALKHSRKAIQTGTKNATILYHAGMIELANENPLQGESLLQQALESNRYFSIAAAKEIKKILTRRLELSATGE